MIRRADPAHAVARRPPRGHVAGPPSRRRPPHAALRLPAHPAVAVSDPAAPAAGHQAAADGAPGAVLTDDGLPRPVLLVQHGRHEPAPGSAHVDNPAHRHASPVKDEQRRYKQYVRPKRYLVSLYL